MSAALALATGIGLVCGAWWLRRRRFAAATAAMDDDLVSATNDERDVPEEPQAAAVTPTDDESHVNVQAAAAQAPEPDLAPRKAQDNMSTDELVAGAQVVIDGLQSAAQFNGAVGVLHEWHDGKGRWSVQLCSGKTKSLLVAPCKLQVCTCRICHGADAPLYAPCACRGEMKWAHFECLLEWAKSFATSGVPSHEWYDMYYGCPTCDQPYTGPAAVALLRARLQEEEAYLQQTAFRRVRLDREASSDSWGFAWGYDADHQPVHTWTGGLYVVQVMSGSIAARAGIMAGDAILSCDGVLALPGCDPQKVFGRTDPKEPREALNLEIATTAQLALRTRVRVTLTLAPTGAGRVQLVCAPELVPLPGTHLAQPPTAKRSHIRALKELASALTGGDAVHYDEARGLAARSCEVAALCVLENTGTRAADGDLLLACAQLDHSRTLHALGMRGHGQRGAVQQLMAESEQLVRSSLGIFEAHQREIGGTLSAEGRCLALSALGGVLLQQNRQAEAEAINREELAYLLESCLTPEEAATSVAIAQTRCNLAGFCNTRGAFAEALELAKLGYETMRLSLGPEHPTTAKNANVLAANLFKTGHTVQAEALFRSLVAFDKHPSFGGLHPTVGAAHLHLAILLRDKPGASAEAHAVWDAPACRTFRACMGPLERQSLASARI